MESKPGCNRSLVAEFFAAPVVVVGGNEGGDGGAELGEVLGSVAGDDLLLEGAVEAFDAAVGLGFAEQGEAGNKAVAVGVGLEVVGEILGAGVVAQLDAAGGVRDAAKGVGEGGSPAAQRSPVLQPCQARPSPFQGSTRSKSQPQPSVAQRRLGVSVVMRPSWAFAGEGRGGEIGAEEGQQGVIRERGLRAAIFAAGKSGSTGGAACA